MKSLLLLCIFALSPFLNGYRILAVFPFCAHSHFTLGFKVVKALVDKGHNVTLVSCYTQKTPIQNLYEISVMEEMKNCNKKMDDEFAALSKFTHYGVMSWSVHMGNILASITLKSKAIQNLLISNETFDAIIMENVAIDAVSILRHKFNCPLILQSPFPMPLLNHHLSENPFSPAYIANFMGVYDSHMNFWERLENTYRQLVSEIVVQFEYIPAQRRLIQELFPGAPDLYDVIFNVSLQFVPTNIGLFDPIPLQQDIKEIGGHHVSPSKPLPKDVEKFMNNATDGVILFSMGSIINGSVFGKNMKNAILKTFSKMKQKVIWKLDDKSLEAPDNVMVKKWIPQNDIMAHRNTILFISHGGLLGTYEAIHHGVPILGLPVVWDQMKNMEEAARKGFAIRLNLADLTIDLFEKALLEIINNPNYRKIAKERSRIMHDRISTPLEEAVFWIEYVIRHKGAHHLRSRVMDLKWYQRYLIDVFLLITVILLSIVYAVFWLIKMVINLRMKIKNE